MSIIAKSDGTFEKAPAGMQQAVCAFVHDIGTQIGEYQGKTNIRRVVIISWELAEKMVTGDYAGKPFMVSKYYTLSLNEKATLRKDLESWRGRAFKEEELEGFDVEKLIGVNCFLNITTTENDKRKISAITPIPKNIKAIKPSGSQPSEKYMAWIDKERAKSVEVTGAKPTHQAENEMPTNEPIDDLPF